MANRATLTITGRYAEVLQALATQEQVSIAEIVRRCMQHRYGIDLENAEIQPN